MWVIRGGEENRLVDRFVDAGAIAVVFPEVPDAEILTRSEIRRSLASGQTTAALDAQEAMLSAFVREIQVGDSVLLPDPSRGEVIVGTVTSGYEFQGDPPGDDFRHRRTVDWLARHPVSDLPSAVQPAAKARALLQQDRNAAWSAYLAQVREGEIGRDPKDRRAKTVTSTPRRRSSTAAVRLAKPVVAMRTCPSCFLQKHPDNFHGDYCADCSE